MANLSQTFLFKPTRRFLSTAYKSCKHLTKTFGLKHSALDRLIVVYCSSVTSINATMSLYSFFMFSAHETKKYSLLEVSRYRGISFYLRRLLARGGTILGIQNKMYMIHKDEVNRILEILCNEFTVSTPLSLPCCKTTVEIGMV